MDDPTIITKMCQHAKSQDWASLEPIIHDHPNSIYEAIEQLAESGEVSAVNFSIHHTNISWHHAIAGYARGGHLAAIESIITHCAKQEWKQRGPALSAAYLTAENLVDYRSDLARRIEHSLFQISQIRADYARAQLSFNQGYSPTYSCSSYIDYETKNLRAYQEKMTALRPLVDSHLARLNTAARNFAHVGNVAAVEDFYQRGANLESIIAGFKNSTCFTNDESALRTLTHLNNAVLIANLVKSFQPQLKMVALLDQAKQMKEWMQKKNFSYEQARVWCNPKLQILFLQGPQSLPAAALITFAAQTYSLTDLEAEDLYTKAQKARAADKQAALKSMTTNAIAELNTYISSRVKNEDSLELTTFSKVFHNHDLTRAKVKLAIELKKELLNPEHSAKEIQSKVETFKIRNKTLETNAHKHYHFFGHSRLAEKLENIEPMVKRQIASM